MVSEVLSSEIMGMSIGINSSILLILCLPSGDATLSRHKGINISELALHTKMSVRPSGELWRGKWQGNEIVAKILALRECSSRICRDFNEEFPRLRYLGDVQALRVFRYPFY